MEGTLQTYTVSKDETRQFEKRFRVWGRRAQEREREADIAIADSQGKQWKQKIDFGPRAHSLEFPILYWAE